jgi:hypothetical protein
MVRTPKMRTPNGESFQSVIPSLNHKYKLPVMWQYNCNVILHGCYKQDGSIDMVSDHTFFCALSFISE